MDEDHQLNAPGIERWMIKAADHGIYSLLPGKYRIAVDADACMKIIGQAGQIARLVPVKLDKMIVDRDSIIVLLKGKMVKPKMVCFIFVNHKFLMKIAEPESIFIFNQEIF